MSERRPLPAWQALLAAVPLATIALAVLELTRVPANAHHGEPMRILGALAHIFIGALLEFAIPTALCVAAAFLLWLAQVRPARARWARLGLVAVALLESAWAREVLIAYHPFANSLPVTFGFVLLGIALAAVLWMLSNEPRRAVGVLAALAAIAALAVARAHYGVFVGLYPTLHASILVICFLTLTHTAAAVLVTLRRDRGVRRAIVIAMAVSAAAVLIGAPSGGYAWARPYVVAYTELGRAAGVARAARDEATRFWPTSLPEPRDPQGPMRPDDEALDRFAALMPALPAGFDLSRYDVLWVLSDATRHDLTSLALGNDGPTPELAELAQESLVFDRAISPSNGTFPSVAAGFSLVPLSLADLDVRERFWQGALRSERTTAAEAMQRSGRRTFWIGHDHKSCFSEAVRGLEQGFDTHRLVPQEPGQDADADARIAELAVAEIGTLRRARQRFFGLVFFVSPHDDYQVHDPSAPAETDLDRYTQELRFMDHQLGRVLDSVDLDRTVVIFSGDHGEGFGEHGYDHHLTSLHAEQVRVPLVVHVPGLAPARIERPTSTIFPLVWLMLRGAPGEQEVASQALRTDIGPMLRETEGAIVSEMIGQHRQEVALVFDDYVVQYDLFADLLRVFDGHEDLAEEHDLREERPELVQRFAPLVQRYRAARFAGQRFRFIETAEP